MLLISRSAGVLANHSPKRVLDPKHISRLRAQGLGWKKISRQMSIGVGTLYRLAAEGSKIREKVF